MEEHVGKAGQGNLQVEVFGDLIHEQYEQREHRKGKTLETELPTFTCLLVTQLMYFFRYREEMVGVGENSYKLPPGPWEAG